MLSSSSCFAVSYCESIEAFPLFRVSRSHRYPTPFFHSDISVTVITAEPIKKDRYNYTAHGNEYEVRYSLQHSGRKVHNLDEWVKEATTDADHSILTGLVELSYSNSTDDANGKVVFRFNSRANASRFPEMFEQRCSFHNILTGHPAWGLQSHLETHGFLFFIEGRPSLIDNNVSIPVSVAELVIYCLCCLRLFAHSY